MHDRRMNAYGVSLKRHFNSLVEQTPQKIPHLLKILWQIRQTVLKMALKMSMVKLSDKYSCQTRLCTLYQNVCTTSVTEGEVVHVKLV